MKLWGEKKKEKIVERLTCSVKCRNGVLFDGDCESVSLENTVGGFDILPEHTNFVSVVLKKIVIGRKELKGWHHDFVRGVVRVTSNKVDVVILE